MRITPPRAVWTAFFPAALLLLEPGHGAAAKSLITPSEAALPANGSAFVMRGITRGPTIQLVTPVDGHAPAGQPLALQVSFEPHNGAQIDLSSVKVTYLKTPEIDLTPRLEPYITQQGIVMKDAELPAGTHPIRIDVKDSEGRESALALTLNIGP